MAEREWAMVGVRMLGTDGSITLCYLAPEARYLGFGKAMLEAMEEEARKRGQKRISLGITKTAHGFYARNGYADTGAVEDFFGVAAIMMSKEIDDEKTVQASTAAPVTLTSSTVWAKRQGRWLASLHREIPVPENRAGRPRALPFVRRR